MLFLCIQKERELKRAEKEKENQQKEADMGDTGGQQGSSEIQGAKQKIQVGFSDDTLLIQ